MGWKNRTRAQWSTRPCLSYVKRTHSLSDGLWNVNGPAGSLPGSFTFPFMNSSYIFCQARIISGWYLLVSLSSPLKSSRPDSLFFNSNGLIPRGSHLGPSSISTVYFCHNLRAIASVPEFQLRTELDEQNAFRMIWKLDRTNI
jgi:hypothetical protein